MIPAKTPVDQARSTLQFLHPPGGVFEICLIGPKQLTSAHWTGRAGGKKPIVAGWFRDPAQAAELAAMVQAEGIYTTLNPCQEALLARANGRLKANVDRTADKEISFLRNLLIDIDPLRPAGISSSQSEHEAALALAQEIRADLETEGWPEPLVGDSGNGAHLIYPLEMDNAPENTEILKVVLQALAARYGPRLQELGLEVDQKVFNPARLTKLYGTVAAKGENLPERPHRRAQILHLAAARRPVSRDLLEKLVATWPPLAASGPPMRQEPTPGGVTEIRLDVAAYLAHYGREVLKVKEHSGSKLYCLAECIFDSGHTGNEAAVGQTADGKIFYQCFHNSCRGRTWAEARVLISGNDKLGRFMPGRPQTSPREKKERPAGGAPAGDALPPVTEVFNWSDLGNARRLVARHGRDLRYSHLNKDWYCWTGKQWRVDNYGEALRRAKDTIGSLHTEAQGLDWNSEQRKNLFKFALKSEGAGRIKGMLELAQSEPGISVLPEEFDADPWLSNVQNGVIDLRTGLLQPHRREDLLTCLSPVAYDPKASCPRFDKFLYEIFDKNQDMYDFLFRSLGYALTGDCREQCFWIFWGTGANGKGTLVDCISQIFGSYWLNISTETLLAKDNTSQIRSDVARLDGPRLVTAAEIDRGRRLSESLIKGLSGQDTITARFLYGKDFDFVPQFKLFVQTNNKPIIKDQTNAMWRRLKLVEFPMDFREHPDRELPVKLRQESPGILAWLVKGCLAWQEYGDLAEPQEVIDAVQEYRAEMDPLKDFIDSRCFRGQEWTTPAADLYKAYCEYANENLQKGEILKKKSFGLALGEQGFRPCRGAAGVRLWRGLGLRTIE